MVRVQSLLLCALAFVLVVVQSASVGKSTKGSKKCNRNDPQVNVCFKKGLQEVIPTLVNGRASLGVPPIDPLRITQMKIEQGSGPVSINLTFYNLDIRGIGSAVITDLKADWNKYVINVEGNMREPVNLSGRYKINGKVLVLPIQGDGNCNLTLKDVKAKIIVHGKELKKDGKVYMQIEKLKFTFDTSRLFIELQNLFNGDKALGDNMNLFLNENWSDILKELKPAFEEAFAASFKAIAHNVFLKVSLDQILTK